MGLLDNLQLGHGANFGGGLLDFLRTTQMQQQQYQPSAGFGPNPMDANAQMQAAPMDIGGYQMPRMGAQSQFTPPPVDPAALPPNAQPTQGQMPPEQGGLGGFLSGLNENFQSMGNGGSLIGAMTGQRPNNQTAQFLVSKGMDPAMARSVVADPALLRSVLPQIMGMGGQTDDIKEYQFAKKEDPSLTFDKFMNRKKAQSGEYGLNYVYGTQNGKTVAFAPGKNGEPKQIQFPEGVEIARGIETIKTPTEVITRDKQSGAILSREKLDNAGKEAEEKVGQARGTAQAALANGADIDAAATMKKIDEFASSKGFNEVFGQIDQYRPSWTHSDAGTDSLARYKQLKGTAFLSAYSMLKGGGAITDIEGQKAGDAMARLDRAQGEAEARAALKDFREAVDMGLQKLKRAAGGEAIPSTTPAPAGGSSVDALLKKYGG